MPARQAGFDVQGYYFESRVQDALARNETRCEIDRVPKLGILGASRRLELPSLDEGFSRLYCVRIAPTGEFTVEDWKNEV